MFVCASGPSAKLSYLCDQAFGMLSTEQNSIFLAKPTVLRDSFTIWNCATVTNRLSSLTCVNDTKPYFNNAIDLHGSLEITSL